MVACFISIDLNFFDRRGAVTTHSRSMPRKKLRTFSDVDHIAI
jgi:hypothetical protein